ncbi:glycosyl hydrolase family 28-related protein, partial [Sphingobium jiangsuense]|uniref:glycosyl hydrolase family 28-related protein n=1 Tax=Sphingobium jiangsuense TaxID=870476 RepID=UPI0024E0A941
MSLMPAGLLAISLTSWHQARAPGWLGFSHASDYPAGTLGRKGRDYISVKDAPFNAAGDGETDDTAAFATAINFCLAAKKALYIPGGNKYRIASRITVTMPNP